MLKTEQNAAAVNRVNKKVNDKLQRAFQNEFLNNLKFGFSEEDLDFHHQQFLQFLLQHILYYQ